MKKLFQHGRSNPIHYEEYRMPKITLLQKIIISVVISAIVILCSFTIVHAQELSMKGFSNEEIAQAIFQAEGGYSAKHLYGISSISYSSLSRAHSICLRTIRHHERIFDLQGAKYSSVEDFIKSLGEIYCPTKGSHLRPAERLLNRYWTKNVIYFLKHPKGR